ncbi:hypothetical protein A3SI_04242 [Nitritalea halalkaliphila LW7]|uniref:Uncharacterized protein n=1 Tax=Nitritalea halalkaliphila LW7 TaxID=1189621 RepID=I5C923_9BACT|nr:hypothetical protein [Nitritalea halalkaliphila]EIM78325.1 hypothetical protein A3SI_04242 [Nitritalea halalkaliphila LW7]
MKSNWIPLVLAFVALVGLSSCDKEPQDPAFRVLGNWELKDEILYAPQGFALEGQRDRYIFFQDQTFIKLSEQRYRARDEQQEEALFSPYQALGRFELLPTEDPRFIYELRLVFDTGTDIVASCQELDAEKLFLSLISSS